MDAILVVDDEQSVCELLYSILSRRHWVATARDAEEAISMLGKAHYDVMISDLRMKGADGLELIGEASARWPHLRTVLLSGYVEDNVARRAHALGVSAVVEKPFDAIEFQAQVEGILADARAAAELPEAAAG